jgi:hypothetical protein
MRSTGSNETSADRASYQENRSGTALSVLTAMVTGLVLLTASGCGPSAKDREARMARGYVYYLDGAGGGGLVANWGRGIRDGLANAGYDGWGEEFVWQTRLGVFADQEAGVGYKRGKATELAWKMCQFAKDHPQTPVTLIGLSAGTAIAVFTLEALPQNCQVEDAILLSSSVSSDYDLTRALQRVRNRMYVFTSERDSVLAYLVPIAGTADRRSGAVPSAGLRGFRLPTGASAEMKTQYAKVTHVRWRPDFEDFGYSGGHTDVVNPRFVQAYIAPLVMHGRTQPPAERLALFATRVANPDYERWAAFGLGSSATMEGYQVVDGARRPTRMTARLVRKDPDQLVVERTYYLLEGDRNKPNRVQQFYIPARIDPKEHPFTAPGAKITSLPKQSVKVNDRNWDCEVRIIQAQGDFPEWGKDIACKLHANSHVPGGTVRAFLKTHKAGQAVEFNAELVDWKILRD